MLKTPRHRDHLADEVRELIVPLQARITGSNNSEPTPPRPSASVFFGAELRHLVALQAVAQYGSFSRAAEVLEYTQSAISQQIAALEKLVGQRLVYRAGGSSLVTLTDIGAVIAEHVEAVLDRLAAARADVLALTADSVLRVGTFQSVGVRILPGIMKHLAAHDDHVRITLTESNSEEDLLALMGRGELDMAFTCLPTSDESFAYKELMRDPFVLLAPRSSALAKVREPLSLETIAEQELIGLGLCADATLVEEHFAQHGLPLRFIFRSSDNGTVLGLVAAGVGVALVPELLVEPSDRSTIALEINAQIPARQIAIAWHKNRTHTPAEERFVAAAETACRQLQQALPRASQLKT